MPLAWLLERRSRPFLYQSVNATTIYLCAYTIMYLVYQLSTLTGAHYWGMEYILIYEGRLLSPLTPLSARLAIAIIALSGMVLSLLLAIFLLHSLFHHKRLAGLQRLFVLWLALHGLNLCLGTLLSGLATGSGAGHVAGALLRDGTAKVLLAAAITIAMAWTGTRCAPRFLACSTSVSMIGRESRHRYMLSMALIPWMAGGIITLMLSMPGSANYLNELLPALSMGLLVLPAWANRHTAVKLRITRIRPRIHYTYTAIMATFMLAWLVAMAKGWRYVSVFDVAVD